jgi:hypothetical protein
MKSGIAILTATLLLAACGKSGGGSADPGTPPNPIRNPGDSGEDGGRDGFYPGILDSESKHIPITHIPSILEDGKLIQICKVGQTVHLDECFDELHVSDKPGFSVTRPGKLVTESEVISESWIASFSDVEHRGSSRTMRHRQTYRCEDWCSELPTFYGSYGARGTILADATTDGRLKLGASTTIFTFFTFGGLPGKPVHVWLANGTITLNEKTLRLPATRRDIRNVLPNFHDDRARTDSGNLISFKWEDETYGIGSMPADKDELRLISITFDEIAEDNHVQPDTN